VQTDSLTAFAAVMAANADTFGFWQAYEVFSVRTEASFFCSSNSWAPAHPYASCVSHKTRGIAAASLINPAGNPVRVSATSLQSAVSDYMSSVVNPTFTSLLLSTSVRPPRRDGACRTATVGLTPG
jgi:hypothetical protein